MGKLIINGEEWINYLFEYDWEGSTYSIEIPARSQAEAEARLKRLPLARYVGSHAETIPVTPATRITVPLRVWWRNMRHWLAQPF